jgi:hypothetical protein
MIDSSVLPLGTGGSSIQDGLAMAALTADLVKAVACLEADWAGQRVVTTDAARDVHELRERAERLFASWS